MLHNYQFIFQELAPFPTTLRRLLVRHRACLSALLYKSTLIDLMGTNVTMHILFVKEMVN
jgi:hypothetical protein